ncbi:MAG: FeoA family protein [Chloroflexota bacterium]|nr:FeoA family protein [Chloroflexota bacterium]
MGLLTEVEPETKVVVKKIEGGSEIKASLGDLGIEEGVELTLLATQPVHAHVGPISLKVAGKEVIVSQGWADKIFVEKEGAVLPLLSLEKGDKGVVKSIEAGGAFKDWVSELGINEGSEVEFLMHIPDEVLVVKIDDKEIKMGPGRLSRVWVEVEGKIIQVNYLAEGKKAKVSKVTGGTRHKQEMDEVGIKEGVEATLIGREKGEALPKRRGNYVLAKLGEQMITIGRGMAEKILVE